MIIVTGSITAKEETFDELLALSLKHVHRSRTEAGCISHNVHQDAENTLRLVFLEEWADLNSLLAHFAVPESREFVKTATRLASETPQMNIFTAEKIEI